MKIPNWSALLAGVALLGCSDDDGGNTNDNQNNQSALCGNGQEQGVEECDDGAANSDTLPDACRTDCRLPHCGDGVTDTGEGCDDGPQNSDLVPDACRRNCQAPRCGDGVADVGAGEGCDCGDGTGELPRRCSSPNSDAEGATCRTTCVPAGCGDGRLEGEELCDGELLGAGTCQTYGYYTGQIACTAACSYDFSGCAERCNDGILNGDEVCDGAPPFGESCVDYGFDFGRLGCSPYCTPGFELCGDIGWKRVQAPPNVNLAAIWFDPAGEAWIAGHDLGGGLIGRHDGVSWTSMPLPLGTDRLQGIWGTSASDVWAVGLYGTVIHFNGTSWGSETLSGHFSSVWGSGPNDIYVAGVDLSSSWVGRLHHFDGTSWSPATGFSIPFNIKALWGSGPSDVHAVGDQGNRLHFNGTSWSHFTDLAGYHKAVWGTGPSDVFVGGTTGIHHFDGSQWAPVVLPASAGTITSLWGTAPDNVFALGDGTQNSAVLLHFDGAFWREFDTGPIGTLLAVGGASPTSVLAVGNGGAALRFSGVGWTRFAPDAPGLDSLLAVWGASPGTLFLAGAGAAPLFRHDASGWQPICMAYQYCGTFRSLWGSGPSDVFFVGGEESNCNNQVVHFPGGACSATTLTDDFANHVWGRGPNDVWVASESSVSLSHYTTAWSPVTEVSGAMYAVWGSSDGHTFAVGSDGVVWHEDGAGWTSTLLTTDDALVALWGSGADDVWVLGGPGKIYHYDGTAWTEQPLPTSFALRSLWGRSATDVFAVGSWGTVLHYDGVAWSPLRTLHGDVLYHVWGIGKVVYFVRQGSTDLEGLLDLR